MIILLCSAFSEQEAGAEYERQKAPDLSLKAPPLSQLEEELPTITSRNCTIPSL
jgi:hypothetical protein